MTYFHHIRAFAAAMLELENKDSLAWFVARDVVEKAGFRDCVVYYVGDQENTLVQQAAIGDKKSPSSTLINNRLEIPFSVGITGSVATSRTPIVVDDVRQDTRYIQDLGIFGSELCVPIVSEDRLFGVIDCEDPVIARFGDEELEFLRTIAALMSARLKQLEQRPDTSPDVELRSALQETVERTSAIERIAQIGQFVWDGRQRRTVSVSSEYARLHGMDPATYVEETDSSEKLMAWIHPEDRETFEAKVLQARESRTSYDVQFRIVLRDNQIKHVREIGDPIFDIDGDLISITGIMQDITDRTATEAVLSETEVRFRQLLDRTREGYWYIDTDGVTIDANPAMCALLDRPRREIVGRHIYDFVDERNRTIFEEQIAKRRRGEDGNYEIDLMRPDGSLVACINTATAVFDIYGKRTGSVGLWTDITEQRTARRLIERSRDEAENANRAKSEFLSSMSHELRTPLNAILGFGQLLRDTPSISDSTDGQVAVDQILRGGNHLLSLINDVLNLAQIETGNVLLSMEPVDPISIVQSAVEMLRATAAENHVDLTISRHDTADCKISVDPVRYKQVILNILSNSIKYNKPNGNVYITLIKSDEYTHKCIVRDTGRGIDEARRSQIFQPFNRLGAEKGEVDGTGIGLAITQQLTTQMGGAIGYEPGPGQGSTFWVEFPIVEDNENISMDEMDAPIATASDPASPEMEKLVLYIEDNPANLLLMEKIIERIPGLSLISAHSAEIGLELARDMRPEVILMDINLPGMSGIEAIRRLRQQPQMRTIPVIAISADAMPSDVEKGMAAGFYRYIKKPIVISEAIDIIKNCI